MIGRMIRFLSIPAQVRTEFQNDSLKKNDFSLIIICIIITVSEIYNIFRVLFLSVSGLGTLNNRIYFGMYCFLLFISAGWYVTRPVLRRCPGNCRIGVQYTVVFLIFLWHIILNTYDLICNPDGDITLYTMTVLALAVFIQMGTVYSIFFFGLGYLLFLFLAEAFLPAGTVINMTITSVVAFFVSRTNSYNVGIQLLQRQEITQINARLREKVQQDPLTGLFNKKIMKDSAEKALKQIGETGGVTFFILDVDDFKAINDSFGHPFGDYVLMEMASVLRKAFHADAYIGRIGGDEYAVLLNFAMDRESAVKKGEQLAAGMVRAKWQEISVDVRCSVGVCVCTCQDVTYPQLYQEADSALYAAKKCGKGQCVLKVIS